MLALSPLGKGWGSSLNKLESSSPKDALCQVCLKFAQWKKGKVYSQTDRQTDGGQQAIRKAHLSFQLR